MMYFCFEAYCPNTAASNRALAYLREIDKQNVCITVLFFMPDDKYSKISDKFKNIKIIYLWDRYYLKNKYLRYISVLCYQLYYASKLRKGDTVYVYGYAALVSKIIRKRGLRVFMERTEHPLAYSMATPLYNPTIEKYLGLCKKLTGLIVISNSLKKYFIEEGVEESRVHIVNMIVDEARFKDLVKSNNADKYIAYCGTASNSKDGVNELIRAFSIVSPKYPDYKLMIIGKTPSKIDEELNCRLCDELGIKDKVIFTGEVDADEMPQLLKNAEILALARPNSIQAQYGFPTKLGEYLLTENPVVVTDVGDLSDFLTDRESILFAQQRDSDDFAKKLSWALEFPDKAREIGINGAIVAKRSFSAETEARKLIDILSIS